MFIRHINYILPYAQPPPINERFRVRACFGQNIGLTSAVYSRLYEYNNSVQLLDCIKNDWMIVNQELEMTFKEFFDLI